MSSPRMEIELWNNELGCWDYIKTVEWLFTWTDRKFLWWKWKKKLHCPVLDYCVAAVNCAKQMYLKKENLSGVRVRWSETGDIMWQNGQWQIDTKRYSFFHPPKKFI